MKNFRFIIILLVVAFIIGCSKNDNVTVTNDANLKKFVSINPSNPLLLKIEKEDNTIIEYYGKKDQNGLALSCDLISIKTDESEEIIYVKIDLEGRPLKVFSADGSSISFNYDDISDIRVSVVTSNGESRLSFSLNDFNSSNKISDTKKSNKRKGKKIELLNNKQINNKQQSSCNISNLNLHIDKCGDPFNLGTIILLAKGVNVPNYQARYESKSDGNGNYCFLIDEPKPSSIQLDKLCKNLENVLGKLCFGLSIFNTIPGSQLTLCSTISSAFTVASLPAFASCEILINGMNLYCDTLGADGGGPDSVLSTLCKSEILHENIPTEFTFKPAIYIDGGSYILGEETGKFSTVGPFPSINITIPGIPIIADFDTNPLDPKPEQDYIATALVQCLEGPSKATITVVGTDDYTDSITVELPAGNSTISLSVPGAEGGVQDSLTIVVDNLKPSTRIIIF